MTRDTIRDEVLRALAGVAPEVDMQAIAPDRPLRDQVDLDSMDFLNVVIALKGSLGIEVPETDYGKLATVSSAIEYLAGRLGV